MLARTLGSLRTTKAQTVSLVTAYQAGQPAFPDYNYETLYREGYSKNELVFGCIEEWATDFAEPPLRAYRATPNGAEIVPDHPAVQLWTTPNPWLSGSDLQAASQMYKRLAGNTFILKVRSGARKVVELWLLRPDLVKIIPDRDNFIKEYQYTNGGGVDHIPPDDIIHLKTRHPFNAFYGFPPLMAAAGRTDIDNWLKNITRGYLMNMGIPAGILRLRAQVAQQDKQLFQRRFRGEFGGENAGNVMVVTGDKDSASFEPLGMNLGQRGLVVPELDEIDEARIPMVFRVPPSILGSRLGMNSSSYGNRKSDREEFTQRQLSPEWQSVGSALSQSLLPEFGDADFLAFDTSAVAAMQPDMDAVSKRIISEVQAGLRTLQEGRKGLGLSPTPSEGDTMLVPGQWLPTPVAQLESGQMPAPVPPQLPPGEGQDATRSWRPQVIFLNQPMRKRVEYDEDGRPVGTVEEPVDASDA